MKQKQLFNPLFLVTVVLLMLNDFYFKYRFHNYFTGKLSDVVGLFAFPYFFSTFFPKRAKLIYLFTAVWFTFWKSGLSQPLIDAAHYAGLGIGRTIDYTDCFALFILPLSYRYWQLPDKFSLRLNAGFKPVIVGICCFAFVATSTARKQRAIMQKSDLEITLRGNSKEMIAKMGLTEDHDYQTKKYNCTIDVPDKKSDINLKVILNEVPDGKITIKLDSIFDVETRGGLFGIDDSNIEYANRLTLEDCESLFLSQKVSRLFPRR